MLVHIRCPAHQVLRSFHAAATARNLIGPVHPITNLRPIVYDDIPVPSLPSASSPLHPYSLSEFASAAPTSDYELQWRLHRVQTEVFHHNFWLDSNSRFAAAKQAVLSCLPPAATEKEREDALSQFYKQWVTQEADRTNEYTTEWRRRNFTGIMLGAKVEYRTQLARIRAMIPF